MEEKYKKLEFFFNFFVSVKKAFLHEFSARQGVRPGVRPFS
jgi:hypothetical protein